MSQKGFWVYRLEISKDWRRGRSEGKSLELRCYWISGKGSLNPISLPMSYFIERQKSKIGFWHMRVEKNNAPLLRKLTLREEMAL